MGAAHQLIEGCGQVRLVPVMARAARDEGLQVLPYRATDSAPAWTLAAAWILALPVSRLTVLRAHLLSTRALNGLLALRARTGVHLHLVCHQPKLSAALERALARTGYDMADADAVLSQDDHTPPHPPRAAPDGTQWIDLPALTTLTSYESSPACACTPPTAAERGFRPPVLPTRLAIRVAHRLDRTAHPHLAAHLATAVTTAASTSQLNTARVLDLAPDGTTLTLHDRHNIRQGCTTHPVPAWAHPLLRATAFTHLLATGERSSALFTDPLGAHGLPSLKDFAEHLRLRPPQPPPPRRKPRKGQQPTATIWPVSSAHHALRWTAEENMQGCPQPPHHRP